MELAQYLHACAWLPAMLTFQEGINNGNFITWPGIEEVNFQKLLGSPLSTVMGHLYQEKNYNQQNKNSFTLSFTVTKRRWRHTPSAVNT